MVSIAVVGPAQDKRITSLLRGFLPKSSNVLWVGPHGIFVPPKPPALIVWDTPWPEELNCPCSLVVLKQSMTDFSGLCLPPCQGVVLGSDNSAALNFLAGSSIPAITCGLSGRDSLTLTSMTENSAVIALQRNLPRHDGSYTEPMELPINFAHTVDRYALLCGVATLGFCGRLGGAPLSL